MAANKLVQTRIDGKVKDEAAAVLAAMGLTVSDAVRLMLTKIGQEKALPFEPLIPNATTIAAMKEARAGKGEVVTLDELRAELRANDYTNRSIQARLEASEKESTTCNAGKRPIASNQNVGK